MARPDAQVLERRVKMLQGFLSRDENDELSWFGLGASVWSADVARASAIAAEIDAGTTWVNQHVRLEPDVPFGGQKQSGIGREMGYGVSRNSATSRP